VFLRLTVVTGPNAAGKSNIGRCLDVARAVLAAHDDPEAERLDLYQDAGYEDAPGFTIKLGIELDQAWEQDLRYIRFLDAFAIPWAAVADGPALRKGQKLALDLRELGHWPHVSEPADPQDFPQWRDFWEHSGVFTLADQFGDDGSKRGELEALLKQIDPELLTLPPDLKARLLDAFDLHILWNKAAGQATIWAEITDATLKALPGILNPGQDGYDDTSEHASDQPELMEDLFEPAVTASMSHRCG
jgi:hypothetical protein